MHVGESACFEVKLSVADRSVLSWRSRSGAAPRSLNGVIACMPSRVVRTRSSTTSSALTARVVRGDVGPRGGRDAGDAAGAGRRSGSRIEALTAKVLDHGDILKVGTARRRGRRRTERAGEHRGLVRLGDRAHPQQGPRRAADGQAARGRLPHDQPRPGRRSGQRRPGAGDHHRGRRACPTSSTNPTRRDGETYLLERALEGHHAIALKQMGSKLSGGPRPRRSR